MTQLELPMDIPTIPYVIVHSLWGPEPSSQRMFLSKYLELLPWDNS